MSLLHRTTIVLSTMLLIAGCAAPESLSTPPEACPDANPGFITIVINYSKASEIRVPQDPQIAVPGDVLQFILRGEDNVLVSTSGKTAADGWLNGSGKKKARRPATERFLVCVPRDILDGVPDDQIPKEYSYNVDASSNTHTWPQLDPIVIIDNM
jgi:hypothetical protein